MVSAWFIAKALVVFAPLTSVWAHESKFPALLDATGEELTLGLERGDFTSVNLVEVCLRHNLLGTSTVFDREVEQHGERGGMSVNEERLNSEDEV